MQLKLRDIEVANDDFERQARNTTSSLEDMESKYNVAIERAVMMDEEIKLGEQEREGLRVEAQRLREELSDLKIEAEILQDKIKKQEERHLSAISTDLSVPGSPTFDHSPVSTASSPLITTPPDTAEVSTKEAGSEMQDPPSPPMSDASAPMPMLAIPSKTPIPATRKSRLPSLDHGITPKPRSLTSSTSSRPPGSRIATASASVRTPAPRATTKAPARATSHRIPNSTSLTHIRSLTAKMQRLEQRVQSARSKLPAPTATPPRDSPRSGLIGGSSVPSTVTMRTRKRTVGSTASSVAGNDDTTPTNPYRDGHHHNFNSSVNSTTGKHVPRLSTSGVSRLSFGPLPNRNPGGVECESSASRPSSRASVSSSFARPSSRTDHGREMPPPRPVSRTSLSGARTPLGVRPRSSMSGSLHGHSQSVSYSTAEVDEGGVDGTELRTPSRRGTYSKFDVDGGASSIPVPSSSRRQSGGNTGASGAGRRTSGGGGAAGRGTKLTDVGETY